jgi:hypothetical protein
MPASVEDRMAKLGFPKPSAKTTPKDEDKPKLAKAAIKPKTKAKPRTKKKKKKGIS